MVVAERHVAGAQVEVGRLRAHALQRWPHPHEVAGHEVAGAGPGVADPTARDPMAARAVAGVQLAPELHGRMARLLRWAHDAVRRLGARRSGGRQAGERGDGDDERASPHVDCWQNASWGAATATMTMIAIAVRLMSSPQTARKWTRPSGGW